MPAKTLSGARALVQMADPVSGSFVTVGIFNNVSYDVSYDVQSVYILGRYSAAELAYTSMNPVTITASAWRVIDRGPHVDGQVPRLQDLMGHNYIQMLILDRQTGRPIATIRDVRPAGYSSGLTARQLQETTHRYIGLLLDDESVENNEANGAAIF